MAAPITVQTNGQRLEAGIPVPLFTILSAYDITPDGQRILINQPTGDATTPITLILNWKPPKP